VDKASTARTARTDPALAFKDAYRMLFQRIGIFTALPLRSLDHLSLQNKVREIGQLAKTTPP
jgi:arsenate reductase